MAEQTRFHPWIARVYDYLNLYFEHRQAPPHREYLARDLSGTVLEIGIGTGRMFPYVEAAGSPATYYGVEPDPGMRRQASVRLTNADIDGSIVAGLAERLPFADGRFDAVLVSCVFCSIPDVDGALAEIARVLAPDGEFRFFEHVRSSGPVGRSQDYLTPVWRRLGGNCHLNREFVPDLRANAALELAEAGFHTSGHYPIREFVRGRAVPSAEAVSGDAVSPA